MPIVEQNNTIFHCGQFSISSNNSTLFRKSLNFCFKYLSIYAQTCKWFRCYLLRAVMFQTQSKLLSLVLCAVSSTFDNPNTAKGNA